MISEETYTTVLKAIKNASVMDYYHWNRSNYDACNAWNKIHHLWHLIALEYEHSQKSD